MARDPVPATTRKTQLRRPAGLALCAAVLLAIPLACATRRVEMSLAPLPADQKVVLSPADLGALVPPARKATLREAVVKRLYHDGSYELIGMFRSDVDDLIGYSKVMVSQTGSFAAGYYLGEGTHFRNDTERATGASLVDLDRHVDWADDAAFEELDRDGHPWGFLFFGRKAEKILVLLVGGLPDLSPDDFEAISHRKMEELEQYDPRPS
jgi:hypothetical protein